MEKCFVCGQFAGFKFALRNFRLYQCSFCLHQFFVPVPSSRNLKKIYAADSYYRDGQKFPFLPKQNYQNFPQYKTFTSRLSKICSLTTLKRPKILDVGCGTGLFINLCRQQGIKATGIDFSEAGIKLAKDIGSHCFHQDFLKDIADSCFDIVTMFDTIEHLVDPGAFLKKSHSVLRKKGLLVLTTPRNDSLACKIFGKKWHLYIPPRHLHIFSSQSIRLLLERQGFKILAIKNLGQWSNTSYMLSKVLSIYNIKPALVEKLILKAGIYRFNLYINLFDVMTVFAQKQ